MRRRITNVDERNRDQHGTSATGIDAASRKSRAYRSLHDAWNERDAATFAAL